MSKEEFPPPSAPMAVARQIFDAYMHGSYRTLMSWRGGWMRWEGPHWEECDHAELRSEVYRTLEDAIYVDEEKDEEPDWNPNRHKVSNVMEAMAAVGHLSSSIDPPSWLAEIAGGAPDRTGIISCRNGLLRVADRTLFQHTPLFFNQVSVPFDYQHDAPEPAAWLEFLNSIWPDDPDSIALLQEYTGYILSGRTDMQKALLLTGPTRSGKGTYARLLSALVGRGNAAGPTLASLGTNFGLAPLLGKPLAVVADARLGDGNVRTVVERLLSITGEDMLTVDRKFKEPWSGKLPSRFVVLSNELPRFGDASGAIANRFLVLRMTKSFLGKEDRGLDDRLTAELPGILSWALDGLDRLMARGRFTVPESSQDATTLMMDLASPISAFVRDCCVRTPDTYVDPLKLYEAWKTWCEDNGHRPGSNAHFGKDLRAAVPELLVSRPRVNGKPGPRRYERIGMQTDRDDPRSTDLNADPPGSPGSLDESAGNSRFSDDGSPGSATVLPGSLDSTRQGDPGTDPGKGSGKPQVTTGDPGDPGESAFKAQLNGSPKPTDPCPVCGKLLGMSYKSGPTHLTCRTEWERRTYAINGGAA